MDAQRATYAQAFVDNGNRAWPFMTIDRIDGDDRLAQQFRHTRDAFDTTGRALVVVGAAVGDRFSIRTACGIAAFRTLRLG